MKDYYEALQTTLTVANYLAPNEKVQIAIGKMVAEMQADNANPSDIVVQVWLAVADGLRYGNWIGEP